VAHLHDEHHNLAQLVLQKGGQLHLLSHPRKQRLLDLLTQPQSTSNPQLINFRLFFSQSHMPEE
jgi:hypothetical protein